MRYSIKKINYLASILPHACSQFKVDSIYRIHIFMNVRLIVEIPLLWKIQAYKLNSEIELRLSHVSCSTLRVELVAACAFGAILLQVKMEAIAINPFVQRSHWPVIICRTSIWIRITSLKVLKFYSTPVVISVISFSFYSPSVKTWNSLYPLGNSNFSVHILLFCHKSYIFRSHNCS